MSHVTQSIKGNITITRYAEMIGLHPIPRSGRTESWQLAEHDSCVINYGDDGRQRFIWNSQKKFGSVIDFCMAMQSISQEDAIRELRDILGNRSVAAWDTLRMSDQATVAAAHKAETPFVLPEKSTQGQQRVFAYLIKTRNIDQKIVAQLVHDRLLYQDARGNAVFVGNDYDGAAKYAFCRSTLTERTFRGEASGSQKDIGFGINLTEHNKRSLFVCEAAIDALSIASMLEHYGTNANNYAYLSLGGTADRALLYHLPHQPQLKTIYLCQDNDEAGNLSRTKLRQAVLDAGFKGAIIDKPPIHKDFNEDLTEIKHAVQVQSQLPAMHEHTQEQE